MVKVRTYDSWFGIETKQESAWGTDPGTWGTNSYRVPFRSEDLHIEDDVFPDSEEFGALGALLGIDKGRRIIRGSLVVEPAYDVMWFWRVFGPCFSTEDLISDDNIFADGTQTGTNTHIFAMGSALHTGTAFRLFKSGPDNSGSFDLALGLIPTGWTWDQPEGDRATLSIDFIGKSLTTTDITSETLIALEANPVKLKAQDLSRTNSKLIFGATQANLNLSSFTITVDRRIEAGATILQTPTALDKPGIEGIRSITIDIAGELEQDYNAANKPWPELQANTESKATIVYESDTDNGETPGNNYAIRFDFPKIVWTDVRNNATQAGTVPFSGSARAIWGPLSGLSLADHTSNPAGGSTDCRVMVQVSDADDTDAKFTSLATSA